LKECARQDVRMAGTTASVAAEKNETNRAERVYSGNLGDDLLTMIRQSSLGQPSAFAECQPGISDDAFDDLLKRLPSGSLNLNLDGFMDMDNKNEAKNLSKASSLDLLKAYFTSQRSTPQDLEALGLSKSNGAKQKKIKEEDATSLSGSTAIKSDAGKGDKTRPIEALGNTTLSPITAFADPQLLNARAVPASAIGWSSKKSSSEDYGGNSPGNEMDTNALKRKQRRMLSNRESARRSRKRKQEHMMELENKVSKLTEECSELEKRCRMLEEIIAKKDAELQRVAP